MQIFPPTSVFLTMVVLCSLLSSLSGVVVKYSRETVTKTEGHFVSLKCEVQYDIQNCDIVTNWWYINGNKSKPITDPNHYLITVNETEKNQLSYRNIFLSFNSLSLEDSGHYQCDAKCLNSGTVGKGHLLYLNVKADPYKGLKVSTWSGQLKADKALLALSAILFLSRY
ncbi:uncharacterized protein zgc:174945 [Rhinichthys klamathensis goyatoka]|uniref:uncharacterized protein zgc:174945 n=1 Tax=Rhinichthys klamathensis goyatoka TaxID=3034132 RepID=UPI0024B5CE94|nr:uncharacterized protein zgc:174945 [Rhinichthys klamathensis goyatoka]